MTMTQKKRRSARSAEEWASIVGEWRTSQRTAEDVAAEHGVSRASLYGWAARLRRGDSSPPSPPANRTSSFVGVKVVSTRPEPVVNTEARVELVTKTGRVLRVFGSVDVSALLCVLEAAEAC